MDKSHKTMTVLSLGLVDQRLGITLKHLHSNGHESIITINVSPFAALHIERTTESSSFIISLRIRLSMMMNPMKWNLIRRLEKLQQKDVLLHVILF